MGQALYRKHRPKKLTEVVGQEHITTALNNALKQERISHAYLFTGPRGVGKTSVARILAHEVNGLPYDETATHLDIIEIDAASNRRIDEIRELRERVHSAPASAKYKVYIIDEVHMLTKEAFNALLKTLEEPPAHVIFILATTESHKLPETIISRTQRYSFKPVVEQQVVDHLANIAKQEHIDISIEALELIAKHGDGSFRDSISLLDQASNSEQRVTLGDIQRLLGIAPEQTMSRLIEILQSGTTADLVNLLNSTKDQGYQATQLAKQLVSRLRNDLVRNQLPLSAEIISPLLHNLLQVPASHDPAASLELLLIDIVLARIPSIVSEKTGQKIENRVEIENVAPKIQAEKQDKATTETTPPQAKEAEKPSNIEAQSSTTNYEPLDSLPELNEQVWADILREIKKTHNTLYGVARMAEPQFYENVLTLSFAFAFHQKQINESRNKQFISDIIANLTGLEVEIVCIVNKNQVTRPLTIVEPDQDSGPIPPEMTSNGTFETISNIFGGAEILE